MLMWYECSTLDGHLAQDILYGQSHNHATSFTDGYSITVSLYDITVGLHVVSTTLDGHLNTDILHDKVTPILHHTQMDTPRQ